MLPRRAFFATLAALPLPGAEPGIIDTHTHFYDPSRPQGVPWPPAKDELLYRTVLPEEFVRLAQPLGVTGTIVVEASAWVEDNQWILDLAAHHPVIRGLVGRLEPGTPAFSGQLARFRNHPKFLGIRVGWNALSEGLASSAFIEDMRRLADADLSLDAVGGGFIAEAAVRLSDRVPGLRIVLDHLPFEKEAPLAELKGRTRVFAKVSNFWTQAGWTEAAGRVFAVFGEDRVIYGSNWPVSLRQGAYSELLARARGFITPFGERAARKYFHDNSRAAYRGATAR